MTTTTRPDSPTIGILSTYPPKLCGLATFASALRTELVRGGAVVDVVRIDDGDRPGGHGPSTAGVLVNGDLASVRRAAEVLSLDDVAIVQHEYGIYGGPDGDEVLELLTELKAPSIVVLHTVPLAPTPHQRSVLEMVCVLAGRVVVMTRAASDRLLSSYDVEADKVVTIPHGAATPQRSPLALHDGHRTGRRSLLTWGLLGPGKGIEHAIDAMAQLRDLRPRVEYTVAGVTHPKVMEQHGDAYRHSLIRRAWSSGVAASVSFDDTYRDAQALIELVASVDLVVLPYDSRDQVTSGVLVDAVAAGRPVIATAFPHALELLGTGAGVVVPHGDPGALAAAVRRSLTEPGRLDAMADEARRIAPTLRWAAVAARYRSLCEELLASDSAMAR